MGWTTHRARVASLTRSRPANDPELVAARRDLAAERLAEHVRKVVAEAPPLTAEQRDKIIALFGTAVRTVAAARRRAASPTTAGEVEPLAHGDDAA
jgi:tartrate dehydratase beta subunit/fumarate hydratase class I family protein